MSRDQKNLKRPGQFGGRSLQPSPSNVPTKAAGFGLPAKMGSFKACRDFERRAEMEAADQEYLGSPPEDVALFEASVVIPGKHMLPRGLNDPVALDDIRKKHKVWIVTKTQPTTQSNVFNIYSKSIRQLQEAVKELNWALHDMRLASENVTTQFLVQKPSIIHSDEPIVVKLNARPHVLNVPNSSAMALPVSVDLFDQLQSGLPSLSEVLTARGAHQKMRVNFGRLEIRSRKKGVGNLMPYLDFEKMVPHYSVRGGANLHTRLSDVHNAHKIIQHLQDPAVGIVLAEQQVWLPQHTLTFCMGGKELIGTAQKLSHRHTQLSAAILKKPEKWPRLNWTVVAPDMTLDWNIQVDSGEATTNIPAPYRDLMSRTVLKPAEDEESKETVFQSFRVRVPQCSLSKEIEETVLKTSIIMPLKDTRLLIEVNVSQAWNHTETQKDPEIWWGIELYGVHWDESMHSSTQRKPRGDSRAILETLWPDKSGATLEGGFQQFLGHIIEVQSALGASGLDSKMPM